MKKQKNIRLLEQTKIPSATLLMLMALLAAPQTYAESSSQWGVGAKIHATNWTVKNQSTGDEADADSGRLGLTGKYQNGRFYAGLSILGGDFEFNDTAPPRPTGPAAALPTTVKQADTDLIFGYYFWPKVSLFLDVKNVSHEWEDEYKVEYSGIGYGISAFHPLSPRWMLSGSFGLVPMRITIDDNNVGSAGRSALEISMHYILNPRANLSIGMKNQSQTDEFDNGLEQKHNIGALVFGANMIF